LLVLYFEPGGVSRWAHLEAEMDSLVVVVKDSQCNRLMKPREIPMAIQVAELKLEVAKPSLHKAVLPWTGSYTATQGYLHPLA